MLELSLYLMNGMGIERITNPDDTRRRQLLELWKNMVRAVLAKRPKAERARR